MTIKQAQQFRQAWEALPEEFRRAHPAPTERDEAKIAAWMNEVHAATGETCRAGLALAVELTMKREDRQAREVIADVQPYRDVMRQLDALARNRTTV